jgi:methylated-DNA-[protein]-cysteine S-methyltransferase
MPWIAIVTDAPLGIPMKCGAVDGANAGEIHVGFCANAHHVTTYDMPAVTHLTFVRPATFTLWREGRMKEHFLVESPLGTLTLVNTDGVLSGLYMDGHVRGPGVETIGPRARSGFDAAVEQLREYFARQRTRFTLPVAPTGTEFQRRVWDLLIAIPYGETRTYAQLADAIGNRAAIRAVGSANARNPISVVVPCHRVVGSRGSLTGYAGGLARKQFLLDLERSTM